MSWKRARQCRSFFQGEMRSSGGITVWKTSPAGSMITWISPRPCHWAPEKLGICVEFEGQMHYIAMWLSFPATHLLLSWCCPTCTIERTCLNSTEKYISGLIATGTSGIFAFNRVFCLGAQINWQQGMDLGDVLWSNRGSTLQDRWKVQAETMNVQEYSFVIDSSENFRQDPHAEDDIGTF